MNRTAFKSKARRAFAARKIQRKYRKKRLTAPRVRSIVKRELVRNTEGKFIDTNIGGLGSLSPTTIAVQWQALEVPQQGTAIDRRVGRECLFTHLSAKLMIGHDNFGDLRSNATLIGYVVFLKNAAFKDEFESNVSRYMFNLDNHNPPGYSPLSYFNKSMYPNWMAVAKIKATMKDFVPVAQAPMGLQSGLGDPVAYPTAANTNTQLGRQPQSQWRYVTINKRIRVKAEWGNLYNSAPAPGAVAMSRNKPYFVCLSDMPSNAIPTGAAKPYGEATDRIYVNGKIRLTYHDA